MSNEAKRIADELAEKRLAQQEAELDAFEIQLNTLAENQSRIHNIVSNSIIILQRKDKSQTQQLVSLAIDFNEELGKINLETARVLRDKSWRKKQ